MLDALELATALTSGTHATLAAALAAYELTMLTRMRGTVEENLGSQVIILADDAPNALAAKLSE